ncbi:MAG: hypothetical protein ATN34_03530 [Epulopiscium sp. Nele67-Bin002]|nr:MAG: DNA-binding protein WhiA [Epulopiscium sp. Nuni2H_MBin001]OON92222.1 MAG: hypothetical protein ATN34_03530 [Epulopiscium sp. Nele67-Bin002]OON93933.1 MAG: DNA-binding protein WhiA [Epulopiscium sp. Nele67-Bin001]
MSFSSKIKGELVGQNQNCLHELAGFVAVSVNFNVTAKLCVENENFAKKYFTILEKTFNIKPIVTSSKTIFLLNPEITEILSETICEKRAYLRGAFLGGGSVSNPEKAYHLEFVTPTEQVASYIQHLIKEIGLDSNVELEAKIVRRKNDYVVYLKEGSQIVDLLNIIGAHIALMELENIRIVKELRNNVNRIVNCELANLSKTVSASVRQVEDIEYLQETIGLSSLPPHLEVVARQRLLHELATLKELGQKLNPPVGKSGINHRLKKISEIALQVRQERGGF